MAHRHAGGATWQTWVVGAMTVAASAYAWWALTEYERLNEHYQRELGAAAGVLQATAENAVENVQRRVTSWRTCTQAASSGDPGADLQDHPCWAPTSTFAESQPYLNLEHCRLPDDDLRVGDVVTSGQDFVIVGPPSLCFRFRTDILLEGLLFPESFELIVLADPEGRILHQDGPAQRAWLNLLRWSEREFRDPTVGHAGGPRVANLATLLGDASPGWDQLRSANGRTAVQLGTAYHQLYVHPVTLGIGTGVDAVLGGLVPTTEVVRRALAVDTYFVAILAGLLLVGLLGLPFIKLIVSHQREGFSLGDVHRLYFSTGALLMSLTFAVLAIDGYVRWRAVANTGLETLARTLNDTLTDEIAGVRDQLVRYDRIANQQGPALKCGATPSHVDWFNVPHAAFPRSTDGPHPLLLEQAAWVDPAGMQVWKITVSPFPDKTLVAGRPYFQAVRDDSLFQLNGEGSPFFLVPLLSITDGKPYTFLSIRSALSDTPRCAAAGHERAEATSAAPASAGSGDYVAVATVHLLSLEGATLPAGYGFAIVNREGQTLYHSDARLTLRQNFFAELRNASEARAAMFAGEPHAMSSRYRERPSRLYLQPTALTRDPSDVPAGFYIVVFRDLSPEWAVVARTFTTSLAGPLVLLIGVFAVGLYGLSRSARRHGVNLGGWLWPHGGLRPVYRQVTLALLGVLVLGVGLCLAELQAWMVLWPVVTAGVGLWTFTAAAPRVQPRRPLDCSPWQLAMFVTLFLCMVMIPASAVFRLTLGHEFGVLIETEQRWVREQRDDIQRALRAAANTDPQIAAVGDRIVAARATRFVPPPSPYAEPLDTRPADGGLIALYEWLDHLLPLESDIITRQRFHHVHVAYHPPGSGTWLWFSWFGLVGMAGILVALVAWVRWNTTRLFLADLAGPPAAPPPTKDIDAIWAERTDDERYLLMQVARDGMVNPQQRTAVQRLLEAGLLTFGPELRLSTSPLERFVRRQLQQSSTAAALRTWENATDGQDWRQVRTMVLVSLVILLVFLVATQPAVQSDLVGIGSGTLALAALAMRARHAIQEWLGSRPTSS